MTVIFLSSGKRMFASTLFDSLRKWTSSLIISKIDPHRGTHTAPIMDDAIEDWTPQWQLLKTGPLQ